MLVILLLCLFLQVALGFRLGSEDLGIEQPLELPGERLPGVGDAVVVSWQPDRARLLAT